MEREEAFSIALLPKSIVVVEFSPLLKVVLSLERERRMRERAIEGAQV